MLFGPELSELRLEALALAGRSADALAIGESLIHDAVVVGASDRVQRLALAMARASGSVADWAAAKDQLDAAVGGWLGCVH